MEAERGAGPAPEELPAAADQEAGAGQHMGAVPADRQPEAAGSGADGDVLAPPAVIDELREAEASAEAQPAAEAAGVTAERASAAPSRLQQASPLQLTADGASGATADILRIEHSQDEAAPVLGGLVDLQAESSDLLSGVELQQQPQQEGTAGAAGGAAAGEPAVEGGSRHEADKLGAQKQRVASVLGKAEAAGEGNAQVERGAEGEGLEGLDGGIKALRLEDQLSGGATAAAASSLGAQAQGPAQCEAPPAAALVVVPKLAVGLASGSGACPATARSARGGGGKSARGGSGTTPRFSARRASVAVGGKGRKFSFTAPPHVPRPKTAVRHNYSHTPQRVRQILRDNEALVRRLGEITYSGSRREADIAQHDKVVATVLAGSAQRRQTEAEKVVRQNLELYKRLQAVKPSRDVARTEHRKSFLKSREVVANLSSMKGGAARRSSVAAQLTPRTRAAVVHAAGLTMGLGPQGGETPRGAQALAQVEEEEAAAGISAAAAGGRE